MKDIGLYLDFLSPRLRVEISINNLSFLFRYLSNVIYLSIFNSNNLKKLNAIFEI